MAEDGAEIPQGKDQWSTDVFGAISDLNQKEERGGWDPTRMGSEPKEGSLQFLQSPFESIVVGWSSTKENRPNREKVTITSEVIHNYLNSGDETNIRSLFVPFALQKINSGYSVDEIQSQREEALKLKGTPNFFKMGEGDEPPTAFEELLAKHSVEVEVFPANLNAVGFIDNLEWYFNVMGKDLDPQIDFSQFELAKGYDQIINVEKAGGVDSEGNKLPEYKLVLKPEYTQLAREALQPPPSISKQ